MFFINKKKYLKVNKLYNTIFLLSRNKFLYQKMKIPDSFYTRIYLIFFHLSFLLIQLKKFNIYGKNLSQIVFDYTFLQIETNMRELAYGDVTVNKNMRSLTKLFYDILLQCESFQTLSVLKKKLLIKRFFSPASEPKDEFLSILVEYFDKYRKFTINLSLNRIEKGDINFSYFK